MANNKIFDKYSNTLTILHGFIPSLISTFLIIFKLLNFNFIFVFFLIIIGLILQLFCDFILHKKNIIEVYFFYKVRLPVTLALIISVVYLISV